MNFLNYWELMRNHICWKYLNFQRRTIETYTIGNNAYANSFHRSRERDIDYWFKLFQKSNIFFIFQIGFVAIIYLFPSRFDGPPKNRVAPKNAFVYRCYMFKQRKINRCRFSWVPIFNLICCQIMLKWKTLFLLTNMSLSLYTRMDYFY